MSPGRSRRGMRHIHPYTHVLSGANVIGGVVAVITGGSSAGSSAIQLPAAAPRSQLPLPRLTRARLSAGKGGKSARRGKNDQEGEVRCCRHASAAAPLRLQ